METGAVARRLPLLLGALFVSAPASALLLDPDPPRAMEPATAQDAGSEFAATFLRNLDLRATVGSASGPHLHAPRVGGNLLHVPSGSASEVSATHASGESALVGALIPMERGWAVPLAFAKAGAWNVTVGGERIAVAVPATPGSAGIARAAREVLVALESPFRLPADSAMWILQIGVAGEAGVWEPLGDGAVTLSLTGGPVVAAAAFGGGRYGALLPAPGSGSSFLRVNVSSAALGRASLPLAIEPAAPNAASATGPDGRLRVTFPVAGRWLLSSHEWSAGSHEARIVTVADPAIVVTPRFPAGVSLAFDATFRIARAEGPVVDAPGARIVVESPEGSELASFAAVPDGAGNYTARVALPSAGAYRIRLVILELGVDRAFGVEAGLGAGGDTNASSGPPLPEQGSWWNEIPLPLAHALLAASAAALLRGRRSP